jgi:DNA-directed RNA polymerase subunit RPC12/RpoP
MEKEDKGSKCPRCGHPAMHVDWEKGKAKCENCGHELFFKK